MNANVAWPSVINYEDTDELLFIGSQQDWLTNAEIGNVRFQEGDVLIDSEGLAYPLVGAKATALQGSSHRLSLDEALNLVRQHASVCGHCCVSKMGAPSIRVAIQMVEVIE